MQRRLSPALATGAASAERLASLGRGPEGTHTWAYGVVGMVQLAAHWWSSERSVTSGELVDQLTVLACGGLSALLPPAPAD